ncbi:MAG: thioesterase [Chloroflexota bacterium]|nr:thioesterase [Chloroflexota bacterium]
MAVEKHAEHSYRVRFDEAGASGHLRSSGFLRFAQDMAWRHSEAAGFGRSWYREHGLTWLIRAVELDIVEDVAYGAEIDVSTTVVGFRRVWGRRHSEFSEPGSGRIVAGAIIDWVLLNARGRPARVPPEIAQLFETGATFTPLHVDLPDPPSDATRVEFAVRQSELDPLGHVNNAAYLDYLEEHLVEVGRRADPRRRPRRYRLEFVASAEAGATLNGRGWQDELAWCYHLVDANGRALLRARLETDPALWVGG